MILEYYGKTRGKTNRTRYPSPRTDMEKFEAIRKMTKHTSSKEKIEEAIRLLDKLQDDREGFPTDWTGIRI